MSEANPTPEEATADEAAKAAEAAKAVEARKKRNATNHNKVFSNIEQWVLTRNMEALDKYYQDLANSEDEFKYYTYRQVNGNGSQLVNKLRGIENLNVFYKLKTSTLSLLQPKLRLYKVSYEDFEYSADGSVAQDSVRPLSVPCYREFKFSDNFGIETAPSVEEYLKYETTKPSFRNVGIESFMITQNGESHGAIENNIECKLVLKFKSLKDLNASPPGSPGLRYVDLILWPPARYTKDEERYNPKHYEIKAIVGYTAPTAQQLSSLELTQDEITALKNIEKLNQIVSLGMYDYDISVEENGSVQVTVSFRGRLETAVGTNQVNIFQDNIRLNTEGELELSQDKKSKHTIQHYYKLSSDINAIHMALSESGCLGDCQEKKNLLALTGEDEFFASILKKSIEESLPGQSIRWSTYGLKKKRTGITFDVEDEATYFLWFKTKENVKRLMATMKAEVGDFKHQIFMSFVDQLVVGDGSERTRVFTAIPSSNEIEKSVGFIDSAATVRGAGGAGVTTEGEGLTVQEKQAQLQVDSLTTAITAGDISFKFMRAKDAQDDIRALSQKLQDIQSPSTGAPATNEASEGAPTPPEPSPPAHAWSSDKTGEYKFYFLYLGDIIELACRNAGLASLKFDGDIKRHAIYPDMGHTSDNEASALDNPLVNARILLGPLEYIGSDTKIKKMNLARMPISFRNFRTWFIKKVLKRQRSTMSLGSFLASLINDLVVPSLTVGMPEKRMPSNSRANIISITLPGKQRKGASGFVSCGGENVEAIEEALPTERVLDVESPEFKRDYLKPFAEKPRSSESMIKTSFDYMLIYVTTHLDIVNRRGDPVQDISDGIYHFSIGSDQGLLKKVDFSRVPIPGFAALRSEQMERPMVVGDPANIEQLKFPHNSDVTLIGTSLFVPGMYFYVNPSFAGLGSVESAASIAYQLNLGGYNMVTTVSTNISPGKFVTKISGIQQ